MPTLRTLLIALLLVVQSLPASALQPYLASRATTINDNSSARLDANHASAEELQKLKGIGPRKAAAIVEERQQHGQFIDAQDLTRVKGIGQALVEKLALQLSFHRP